MVINGRKCATGLSRNISPASVVTPPAAIASILVSWRIVPARTSTSPAAISSTPTTSVPDTRSTTGSKRGSGAQQDDHDPGRGDPAARESGWRGCRKSLPSPPLSKIRARRATTCFAQASIFFTPRAAWRRRCSFSTRAMRTKPSPSSPKPTPGATATWASVSSRLENSIAPRLWKRSGIGAQANIEACGTGISQPARPKHSTSTSRRLLVERRGCTRRCPAGR